MQSNKTFNLVIFFSLFRISWISRLFLTISVLGVFNRVKPNGNLPILHVMRSCANTENEKLPDIYKSSCLPNMVDVRTIRPLEEGSCKPFGLAIKWIKITIWVNFYSIHRQMNVNIRYYLVHLQHISESSLYLSNLYVRQKYIDNFP